MRTLRATLSTLLATLVVLAATWAFVWTAAVNVRACQPARPTEDWARAWRVGGLPWRELAVFAEEIRRTVPAGSVVAFRAVPAEHVVAWRIAYLLPDFEIRPVGMHDDLATADAVAVLRGDWPRTDLALISDHRLGSVYRVAP